MMTGEEILELVRAGYTKEEIGGFAVERNETPETTKKTDPEQITEEETSGTENEKQKESKNEETDSRLKTLEDSIIKLTKAIQANNILNVGGGSNENLNAVDALASLMKNPKGGK